MHVNILKKTNELEYINKKKDNNFKNSASLKNILI